MNSAAFPLTIRVSLASAIILGLQPGVLNAKPTTIYLLTYQEGKCSANCVFCSQARSSTGRADMLSRVVWPIYETIDVLDKLRLSVLNKGIGRVCIQALNYPSMFQQVLSLVTSIDAQSNVPVSISCPPLTPGQINQLAEAGIDRIGIPLDVPSANLFKTVKGSQAKGPYRWETHIEALHDAVRILGRGRVSTHFIVGLGERDDELVAMIQRMLVMGVYPGLFAFTPIVGTRLEKHPPPSVRRYRRVQIAHYLLTKGISKYDEILFDGTGRITGFTCDRNLLREIVSTGDPFVTSGCPDCNRPYYNERPRGPIYNFPRRLTPREVDEIMDEVFKV